MDGEGPNQDQIQSQKAVEPELLLQWGNRKRLRRVKVRDDGGGSADLSGESDGLTRIKVRVNRRVIKSGKDSSLSSAWLFPRNSESVACGSNRRLPSSPDKEDGRFYTTRGSMAVHEENGNGNFAGDERGLLFGCGVGEEKSRGRWILPRFFISLSSKEKEEDFMVMKGCKLPQRPKKRAKFIQKTILLVSPGSGLSDVSHERYEVREKKSSRKKRRGLKAISIESDSE